MCMALKCEHYKPCPGCQQNRSLHPVNGKLLCKKCIGSNPDLLKNFYKSESGKVIPTDTASRASNTADNTQTSAQNSRKFSVTPPGTPPIELSSSERTYYETRWNEYKGYYRDPAAYFACHMMILIEVNIQYLQGLMIVSRGESQGTYLKEVNYCLGMLKNLKNQLPEKESQEVMDDEKSMAYIYDSYTAEAKRSTVGGVARVFSSQALALAPNLIFPLDPRNLLLRCGFKEIQFSEILNRVSQAPIERTPEEVLRFFGFTIQEEYAMKHETPAISFDKANGEAAGEDDVFQKVSTRNNPELKPQSEEAGNITVVIDAGVDPNSEYPELDGLT